MAYKLDIQKDADLIAKMDKIRKRIDKMRTKISHFIDETIEITGQKIIWLHKVKDRLGIPEDTEINYNPVSREIIVKEGRNGISTDGKK